jgi:hypothetical protein
MAHKLVWRPTERVLVLTLSGEVTLDDFVNIGQDLDELVKSVTVPLVLLVDAEQVRLGHNGLSNVRPSQTYFQGQQIEHVLVAARDKIIRLTLLVVFNPNRPVLRFFDHMDQAEYHLRTIVRQPLR